MNQGTYEDRLRELCGNDVEVAAQLTEDQLSTIGWEKLGTMPTASEKGKFRTCLQTYSASGNLLAVTRYRGWFLGMFLPHSTWERMEREARGEEIKQPELEYVYTKRCSSCGKVKAGEEFYRNKAVLDGLGSWCRECHRAYNQGNKDRIGDRLWEYRQLPQNKKKLAEVRRIRGQINRVRRELSSATQQEADALIWPQYQYGRDYIPSSVLKKELARLRGKLPQVSDRAYEQEQRETQTLRRTVTWGENSTRRRVKAANG
jgi:hypothetical protein